MNFKVNAPGCPCDCVAPPTGPCGCSGEVTITISNAQEFWETILLRFSPGPCDYLQFAGIDAIEGTYTITLSDLSEEFELVRVASTSNPMDDGFGNEYCLYARLRVEYLGDPACLIAFFFDWKMELLSGGSCPDLETFDFSTAVSWPFNNDPIDPYEAVCADASGTVSVQSYVDPDPPGECDDKFYTFDYVIDYA